MNQSDDDTQKRLVAIFKVEAEEHVRAMSSGLAELENAPAVEQQAAIVETVFREAHSLKGAARAVRRTEIETVCQALESVLASMKRGALAPSPQSLDLLNQALDGLGRLLAAPAAAAAPTEKNRLAPIIQKLASLALGASSANAPAILEAVELPSSTEPPALPPAQAVDRPATEPKPVPTETIRVSAARLDSLLLQAEEMVSAKLGAGQHTAALAQLNATLATWKTKWAKFQPTLRALAESTEAGGGQNGQAEPAIQNGRLLEFLEWNATLVEALAERLAASARAAERDERALGGMVDALLQDMKQALLVPFASVLEVFPRLVRELAREGAKEVELVLRGADIEADRRIVQEIKDPLIHLVRNCIDHGLEKPDERARKNKPPRGTVTIAVSHHNGNQVEILVADDGAGIDAAQVRAAALRLGLISLEAAEKLSEPEALALIFQSGLSTSPLITDLSGRGLGLAIVSEKVEKLGGTIALQTQPGAGTSFRLVLPLTLATFRGVLVRTLEQSFVMPITHVERVLRVRPEDIQTVQNRETIQIGGEAVSLARLAAVLELPVPAAAASATATAKLPVIVLVAAEKRIAFRVDEILGEQEVLVKRLGPQLARVRNFAAATVLGTGQVVPILNVPDLLKTAIKGAGASARTPLVSARAPARPKAILVVEDSITARTLLKHILEAAGYQVKTAVDGVDALTTLRTESFDLVVSDVDMPRLSGLDLTAKIRGDRKLAELPVILLTALESREDRERGIDVGASAYLVKQSFDQSNLLAVIRRML